MLLLKVNKDDICKLFIILMKGLLFQFCKKIIVYNIIKNYLHFYKKLMKIYLKTSHFCGISNIIKLNSGLVQTKDQFESYEWLRYNGT